MWTEFHSLNACIRIFCLFKLRRGQAALPDLRDFLNLSSQKTNGPLRKGITQLHRTVVFNPMSHVGTNAQQSNLCLTSYGRRHSRSTV